MLDIDVTAAFNPDNYVSYNINLANNAGFGLIGAVYISELLRIYRKAVVKNCVDNGFFYVDRKYIKGRTTLDVAEQRKVEDNLITLKILERETGDVIRVDFNKVFNLMMSPADSVLIDDIRNTCGIKDMTKARREKVAERLKHYIMPELDEKVREMLGSWIDSLCDTNKALTKVIVTDFQKKLVKLTNGDVDTMLKVIDIAITMSYTNCNWAYECLMPRSSSPNKAVRNTVQHELSDEQIEEYKEYKRNKLK